MALGSVKYSGRISSASLASSCWGSALAGVRGIVNSNCRAAAVRRAGPCEFKLLGEQACDRSVQLRVSVALSEGACVQCLIDVNQCLKLGLSSMHDLDCCALLTAKRHLK